jgi:hypothetical protein
MSCTRNGMAGSRGVGFGLVVGVLVALLGVWASAAFAKQSPAVVRVSSDPYTDPPGQHRTEVEPDSFSYRGQVVGAFQVGRIFGGGATNIGWVTSRDGGRHFTGGFLPGLTKAAGGPYEAASDPNVAYDAAHRVWLISSLAVNGTPVAVVVSRSRDGRRWEGPVTVAAGQQGQLLDKNWTVCDNSRRSPFYGHCYTEFDDNGDLDRIKMSTSTDGGLSWSAPTNTAGNDLGIGGQPVVQPDGTVIVPINNLVSTALQAKLERRGTSHPDDQAPTRGRTPRPVVCLGRGGPRRQGLRGLAGLPLPHGLLDERHRHEHHDRRGQLVARGENPDRPGRQRSRPLHPRPGRRPRQLGRSGAPRAHLLQLRERQLHRGQL